MKRQWSRAKDYGPSGRKTFSSALCHLLQSEFPGQFGPAVTQLFAQRVEELFEAFYPPATRIKLGQVLWAGVSVQDPPGRNKRIENTDLKPVTLDLVTKQDVTEAIAGRQGRQTQRNRIIRLFRQAYEQGALLSYPDVSLLLDLSSSTIGREVLAYEKETGSVVPRRGTIHDMGPSVSHKSQICYKRLVEKKPTSQVARETSHDPQEVEYYVQCCRRIQLCMDSGMTTEEIALATGHAKFTVQEYQRLIEKLGLPSFPKRGNNGDDLSN
jgi:hypothetical protein